MKRVSRWTALVWGLFVIWPASSALASKTMNSVPFADSSSLATTLWLPDNLEIIRGVVVFTGGQSGNGSGDTRSLADDRFWQRFSESTGFGIVGTQFTGSYTDASSGPGQALLDSLQAFGDKTSHPELANAPLLLEGFSNGGFFSYTFASWKPERVIAFCLNKSGFADAPLTAAFLAVPGLLIWGSEEPNAGVPTVIHSLVQRGRMKHALWAELKDWGAEHEEGGAEHIFPPFFAEMIAARYPSGRDPKSGEVPLLALDEASGWLGDHGDDSVNSNLPTIAAYAAYGGDASAASWLPSEGMATLWRGFVTKSPIMLSAPTAGQQLDASRALQLTAAGLDASDKASFLDGARVLAKDVSAQSGSAKASWLPTWGGVRGIVALGVNASAAPTRTSRPANVVLYGMDAPDAPRPQDAGVPAADGGKADASTSRADAGRDSGTSAHDPGMPATGAHAGSGSSATPPARDAALPASDSDAGTRAPEGGPLHGSCSCEVRRAHSLGSTALAVWSALGMLAFAARWGRRRGVQSASSCRDTRAHR